MNGSVKQFFAAEIGPNQCEEIDLKGGMRFHIVQVALGEVKGVEKVEHFLVNATTDDETIPVGYLSSKYAPQLVFRKVFDKSFKIHHGWKDGSVYVCGYYEYDYTDSDEEEEEEEEDEDEDEYKKWVDFFKDEHKENDYKEDAEMADPDNEDNSKEERTRKSVKVDIHLQKS